MYDYDSVEQENARAHHFANPLAVDVGVPHSYANFSATRPPLAASTLVGDVNYGDKLWWENLVSQYTQFTPTRELAYVSIGPTTVIVTDNSRFRSERTINEELRFL